MTDPRGIRNNNPLNIDYNVNNQWKGLDTPPSDGRFCRFIEPQFGLRAGIIILRNYQKRGLTTLRAMISTWAPAHENNVESYIGFVTRKTGIRPEQQVNLNDKAETIALLKAMVLMECGSPPSGTANGNWLDDLVYEAGWSIANPLTQSRTIKGSMLTLTSAAAGAVVQVAQDVLPQAADAAAVAAPLWPEIARWVLIAVCVAGGLLAFYARYQAKEEGIR
jgi:hypothetical protein